MLEGGSALPESLAMKAARSRSRKSEFCAFSSPIVVTARPT